MCVCMYVCIYIDIYTYIHILYDKTQRTQKVAKYLLNATQN